jgi:hypothetical protein
MPLLLQSPDPARVIAVRAIAAATGTTARPRTHDPELEIGMDLTQKDRKRKSPGGAEEAAGMTRTSGISTRAARTARGVLQR